MRNDYYVEWSDKNRLFFPSILCDLRPTIILFTIKCLHSEYFYSFYHHNTRIHVLSLFIYSIDLFVE